MALIHLLDHLSLQADFRPIQPAHHRRQMSYNVARAAIYCLFQRSPRHADHVASHPHDSRPSDEAQKSHKRKRTHDENEVGTSFNPKYLTSRDLFDLEVGDTAFRRHVLVQALILLDFMLSLTSKSRAKMTDLTNKSVLYGFVLSEDDARWVADMRKRIEGYLQTGPGAIELSIDVLFGVGFVALGAPRPGAFEVRAPVLLGLGYLLNGMHVGRSEIL